MEATGTSRGLPLSRRREQERERLGSEAVRLSMLDGSPRAGAATRTLLLLLLIHLLSRRRPGSMRHSARRRKRDLLLRSVYRLSRAKRTMALSMSSDKPAFGSWLRSYSTKLRATCLSPPTLLTSSL